MTVAAIATTVTRPFPHSDFARVQETLDNTSGRSVSLPLVRNVEASIFNPRTQVQVREKENSGTNLVISSQLLKPNASTVCQQRPLNSNLQQPSYRSAWVREFVRHLPVSMLVTSSCGSEPHLVTADCEVEHRNTCRDCFIRIFERTARIPAKMLLLEGNTSTSQGPVPRQALLAMEIVRWVGC